jgi:acyl-CoA thioester hydrolase
MLYTFAHKHTLRVRYGETDQMGFCYYGNYAQFFEIGRVEALRNLGISYKSLEDAGIMLPVTDLNVKYLKPSFYDDELCVETFLAEIKGARIFFRYEIRNHKNELLTLGETTLVFVSSNTKKPIQAPEAILDALKIYVIEQV